MRLIVCLLLLLLGVGWLVSEIELAAAPAIDNSDTGWRRTRDGWERQSSWAPEQPARKPALHPALIGTIQILFTVAALVALPGLGCWSHNRPPADQPKTDPPRNSRHGPHRFVQYDTR